MSAMTIARNTIGTELQSQGHRKARSISQETGLPQAEARRHQTLEVISLAGHINAAHHRFRDSSASSTLARAGMRKAVKTARNGSTTNAALR